MFKNLGKCKGLDVSWNVRVKWEMVPIPNKLACGIVPPNQEFSRFDGEPKSMTLSSKLKVETLSNSRGFLGCFLLSYALGLNNFSTFFLRSRVSLGPKLGLQDLSPTSYWPFGFVLMMNF